MERLNTVDETARPLMPVRRLHNFAYCPRLFYYQWVENLFVENADTAAGTAMHQRVDVPTKLREEAPDELPAGVQTRSLELSSEALGLVGVVDMAETTANGLELVDYKKGSAGRGEGGEREAKRCDAMQLAAHALMMAERGETVARGWIYYAAEKRRVEVTITPELLEECRTLIGEARRVAETGKAPPPLDKDARCLYCSLYPVCMPEESAYWRDGVGNAPAIDRPPRPDNDEGETLVVQKPGARVGLRGGQVEVHLKDERLGSMAMSQLKAIYLYGAVQVTQQAAQAFLENEVAVAYFSPAGRYLGALQGLGASGVDARRGQYRMFELDSVRVMLAKEVVRAKIHNQRVMLMRNGTADEGAVAELKSLREAVGTAASLDEVRGVEGAAAAIYFGQFSTMLKGTGFAFDFNGRNRRPPRDPPNALLSLGYSMLAKELAGICHVVGLDPFLGFFHQPRYGRPALALDLMEEFRPLIADSVAISLLNRHELDERDFVNSTKGTFLTEKGRRAYWAAYFRRMDTEVAHPEFKYKMTYRRMLDVQVRQLWRFLRGDSPKYHGFTTR